MTVLVTGGNGFVGQALCEHLRRQGLSVRAGVRKVPSANPDVAQMPDLAPDANWTPLLSDVDTVIHTAARVHVMQDRAADPLTEFRRSNTEGTLRLAQQAVDAGVRRFVFVSSIKVNGESTVAGHPFVASEASIPSDPYGISKYEAEAGLRKLADATGLEVVIIRPPLVYGPGVRANFLSMMRWISRGVPLPLGAVHNRRSLVALDNLVDLLAVCARHPAAVKQTFLVSDGEDLSTTDLLRRIGQAMGKPVRLIPVPASVLELGGALVGRGDLSRRLCGSLQIDLSETRRVLAWQPIISVDSALKKTVAAFLSGQPA
ncbi:UDP-glucose 4-epimerase family protein [Paraburkholderia hospita]|uniref:UDP-glucose 4-epimerase family protein n=1 Tax=Paraburkholderia hospita TaxID=169430 RepID=UPI000B348246|nr:SDR family oxidoreductase [Paraburkholderia hospita]OUL88697.1 hypothetical protein CA601_18025 [Paraburkholderia hospita]